MAELKTKPTTQSPREFLETVEPEQKRKDAQKILELMEEITGCKPVMWGAAIVGFDAYHYKSERSSQEGDWPLMAFSPRKQNLTLYVLYGFGGQRELLAKLGKHKEAGGCLHINKLVDVDERVLRKIIGRSYKHNKVIHKTVSE